MTVDTDPVRRAVETLCRLVPTPPPPRDLRVGEAGSKMTCLKAALAAAVLIIAAAGAWLVSNHLVAPETPSSHLFAVEYIRVRGKTVEPRVIEVPGADALVLMAPRSSSMGTEPDRAVQAPAAFMISGMIAPAGRP